MEITAKVTIKNTQIFNIQTEFVVLFSKISLCMELKEVPL
jgi:hypothetical protein